MRCFLIVLFFRSMKFICPTLFVQGNCSILEMGHHLGMIEEDEGE